MSSLEEPCYPRSRKNVGSVDFRCVNCGRALHRTIWAEATEWDMETGKVTEYGLEIAQATCSCGAVLLVGFQPDRSGAVYWLNEKDMREAETQHYRDMECGELGEEDTGNYVPPHERLDYFWEDQDE